MKKIIDLPVEAVKKLRVLSALNSHSVKRYIERVIITEVIVSEWDEKKEIFKEYANCPDSYNLNIQTEENFRTFLNSLDEDEFNIFYEFKG